MTPKTYVTPEQVAIIMPRISDELKARYFYEATWAWCRRNGYKKAAKFFKEQSKEESDHYKWLVKILVDWEIDIRLPAIEAPFQEFESLLDILEQAYEMEYNIGIAYNNDALKMMNLNQMLYRKLFITFVHIQKNETEEAKNRLILAQKWLPSDPNLMDFEEHFK
jgi:ferritin